jgi:Histidine kinase-, DNA gyrase B-, and HSP90-like ATPase
MQVFANLIGNALTFCRAGDTVTLGCERVDGAARFSVEDTGPGIQPELVARLFDPYWSGPGSSGVGFGLYIARGIDVRHVGTSKFGVPSAAACDSPSRCNRADPGCVLVTRHVGVGHARVAAQRVGILLTVRIGVDQGASA